jgi:hypothetical protein
MPDNSVCILAVNDPASICKHCVIIQNNQVDSRTTDGHLLVYILGTFPISYISVTFAIVAKVAARDSIYCGYSNEGQGHYPPSTEDVSHRRAIKSASSADSVPVVTA